MATHRESGTYFGHEYQLPDLVQYLDTASAKEDVANDFLHGTSMPFPTPMDENDKVLSKLIREDDKLDPICLPLLQTHFIAIKELLKRMIPEHLSEGQFWETSAAVRKQTSSVMKHNKLPEFIFGQSLFSSKCICTCE